MKLQFVSHPYSDDPELRKQQVDKICKELLGEGILPISPLHQFSFVDEETPAIRERILSWCKMQMLNVSVYNIHNDIAPVRVYEYPKGLSDGQLEEYQFCLEDDIEMEFVKVGLDD